jgi:hypothetical protein
MSLFADYRPKDPGFAPLDIFNGLGIRRVESRDLAALAQIAVEREGTPQSAQLKLFEKHVLNQKSDPSIILAADSCGEISGSEIELLAGR